MFQKYIGTGLQLARLFEAGQATYFIYYKLDKYKEIRLYVSIYFTIRHARHLWSLPVWISSKNNESNSDRAVWSRVFIFLSWETYPVKAQRWNKSVYNELARTPFKPLF